MAKYINLEDAITELRKSHSIGEAHRRLLQMETINIVQCQDCKKNPKDSMVLEGRGKWLNMAMNRK